MTALFTKKAYKPSVSSNISIFNDCLLSITTTLYINICVFNDCQMSHHIDCNVLNIVNNDSLF